MSQLSWIFGHLVGVRESETSWDWSPQEYLTLTRVHVWSPAICQNHHVSVPTIAPDKQILTITLLTHVYITRRFALWLHFSDRLKRSHWFFYLFNFFLDGWVWWPPRFHHFRYMLELKPEVSSLFEWILHGHSVLPFTSGECHPKVCSSAHQWGFACMLSHLSRVWLSASPGL